MLGQKAEIFLRRGIAAPESGHWQDGAIVAEEREAIINIINIWQFEYLGVIEIG